MQIVVSKEVAELSGTSQKSLTPTGTSVLIEGELTAPPEGTKQVGFNKKRKDHSGSICMF
jgi:hypothetical protein